MINGNYFTRSVMSIEPAIDIRWKKTEKRMEFGFIGLVLIVIVAFIFAASGGAKTPAYAGSPTTTTSFKGSVLRVTLQNSHSITVKYSITNIGVLSGVPACSIYIQDPSGAFPGFDAPVVSRPISAGHTSWNELNIVVSGPGTQYVTQGKVRCG